jgi:tetratricopeptide (TPR) repeat protein
MPNDLPKTDPLPELTGSTRNIVRVAVVQLAYHAAVRGSLADPFGDADPEGTQSRSTLPRGVSPPATLTKAHQVLSDRIEQAYLTQLVLKLRALLTTCREWGVKLVVLPEYSVPAAALEAVVEAAGDMVVVAGTCFVDQAVRKSGVYERLGMPRPALRQSVAPVINAKSGHTFVGKLHKVPDEASMNLAVAKQWDPVPLPDTFSGPLGVLICLDFLERQYPSYTEHVAPKLDQCRLLAVPALTSEKSLPLFEGHLKEEAGPRRRPVLFANYALGGGSTIAVNELSLDELRAYPAHAGVLEKGEEGLLVVDLDLAVVGVGRRVGRYGEALPCTPFAAASLVYSGAAPALANWHIELGAMLPQHLGDADEGDVIDRAVEWLEKNPPPRSGESPMQKRRWDRLYQDLSRVSDLDSLRRLTREVVLSAEVLPLADLQTGLAQGAARVMDRWLQGGAAGAAPFATVAESLKVKVQSGASRRAAWSDALKSAWVAVVESISGTPAPGGATMITPLDRATDTVEDEVVGPAMKEGNDHAREGNHALARMAFERANFKAQHQRADNDTYREKWQGWADRAAIGAATCAINLQDPDGARRLIEGIAVATLSPARRVRLANLWAALGDVERARATLPALSILPDDVQPEHRDVLQRIGLLEGHVPPVEALSSAPDVAVTAAFVLLDHGDAARAAEVACGVLERPGEMALFRAQAMHALLNATISTLNDLVPATGHIAIEARARVVGLIEGQMPLLIDVDLPQRIRRSLLRPWIGYIEITGDDCDQRDLMREVGAEDELEEVTDEEKPLLASLREAQRLVEQGHVEAALATLRSDGHPWRSRFERVNLLRLAGQNDSATSEALALARDVPFCVPVERTISQLLSMSGRHEEALLHAERALSALPARGLRLRVAECLLSVGRARDAWDKVAGDESDAGPRILYALGHAADLVHHAKALSLWQRYIALRPNSASARVHVAQLLFAANRASEAASAAWAAFEAHGEVLSVEELAGIARLQDVLPDEAQRRRRVQAVASTLNQRFPGNARAEKARLTLLTSTGDLASGNAKIDMALLERGGEILALTTAEVVQMIRSHHDVSQLVAQLGRQGALPIALFCAELRPSLPVPVLVTRLLARQRVPAPFSASVALSDVPSGLQLKGSHLLVSEVELYLLGALELLARLRENLGNGRVLLFRSAWMQVLEDTTALRTLAAQATKGRLDEKVAAFARLPRMAPEAAGVRVSDEQLARRHGIAFIGSLPQVEVQIEIKNVEPNADSLRISPRTVLRRLRDQGQVGERVVTDIERYFSNDTETPWADPPPSPTMVNVFFLEQLWENEVLAEFLAMFPGAQIAENDWRALLDRQRESIENKQAADLTSQVHAWIAEGMQGGYVEILPDVEVEGLPPLVDVNHVVTQSLIKEPLEWTARYSDTLAAHPGWWRLVADFFGSTSPIAAEALPYIAWNDRETEAPALLRRLRAGHERHVSLPALVRLLLPVSAGSARSKTLWTLADLGFPDALGVEEILALYREYGGLDGVVARKRLEQSEWMAREPGHRGAHPARLRIADVYAGAIFRVFCGTPGHTLGGDDVVAPDQATWTIADAEALSRNLLGRAESISRGARTDLLESVVGFVALRTLSAPRLAWDVDHENGRGARRLDGPLLPLWRGIRDWAGEAGPRRGAYDRGVREAWISMDGSDEINIKIMSAALDDAVESKHPAGQLAFTNLAAEAEATLSTLWTVRPMSFRGIELSGSDLLKSESVTEEDILAYGARAKVSFQVDRHGRFVVYPWPVPNGAGHLLVFAPAEAILLRQAPTELQSFAGYLKRVQGPSDGRAYRLLAALQRVPERKSLRRAFARRAVSAFWRAVRDDLTYLVLWPKSESPLINVARPSLRELRAVLSEPSELEPEGAHLGNTLFSRFAEGIWKDRDDRWELLRMSCEVPGSLAFGPVRALLLDKNYEQHADEAMSILRHTEDHPIARVARSILLLRAGASMKPTIKLPSGDSIDLREKVPQLLRQVLEQVLATPTPIPHGSVATVTTGNLGLDTFGAAEPLLIRLCGQVVKDLSVNQPLSIREGLWLTYRLFQWLCLQIDALSPDARIEGIRALAQLAPPPEPVRDRLDPYGFGLELFDHRLAAVLHALGTMEDIQRFLARETSDSTVVESVRLAWHPAMIETLVALASRSDESTGLRSELDWDAPDNIADLALVVLLRMDPSAFARLPSEARLRRFRRLPENPEAMDSADQSLFHTVVTGAAMHAAMLSDEERSVLIAGVRTAPRGLAADRWRLRVLPSFFALGDPGVSEDEVIVTLQEQLGDRLAPIALSDLLFGVAREVPERMGEILNKVIAEAELRNIDPVPLAAGVGRVFLLVDAPVRAMVVELIRELGKRAPFDNDERMHELLVAFESK